MPRPTPLRISLFFCILALVLAAWTAATRAQEATAAMEFMERMDTSMEAMDRSMKSAPMNGRVDHDFAAMMVPHHEGAIGMAKAELLYGKDPVMRRLAQEILVDQKSEIDAMDLWLAKQPQTQSPEEVGR
jgi:uncharacterized protein (DUF305 family)